MSTTMGTMGQDLYKLKKEMGYYAIKLYQVDKWFEVSNIY